MNMCFVTKYPPIQGGVSMRCYWLARGLAQRGHTVVVTTNAQEVEAEYRIHMTDEDVAAYAPSFPETGGAVIVRPTTPASERIFHIPFTNPFVTKLAGIARESITEHGCSVVYSYYLEPYGVAAHLASRWTGVPHMVQHAGSDLGRLMLDPELRATYREVLRRAACVCSKMRDTFVAMGVDRRRIWAPPQPPIPDAFSPAAVPLDLSRAIAALPDGAAPDGFRNERPFDPSVPTVGIYGKVGRFKGSFDLLAALAALKRKGLRFNLVAVTNGTAVQRFTQLLHAYDLQERTWMLPFMPHWRIPGFIRACTAVCFLERDFPIAFHTPSVAREVLACGTCLIVSREIVQKQTFANQVRPGENLLMAEPTEHDDLALQLEIAICDPQRAAAIGAEGHKLYAGTVRAGAWKALIDSFEQRLTTLAAEGAADAPRPEGVSAAPPVAPQRRVADATARLEALGVCLPLTKTALGDRWSASVAGYTRPERNTAADHQDAVLCAEFLRSIDMPDTPPWLGDLLKYEQAHNRLYAITEVDESSPRGAPRIEPGDPQLQRLVPRLHPAVRIETFDYDMTELCNALHRNQPPAAVTRTPTIIVFKPERNLVGQEFVINEATRWLLAACDGTRTVADLAALVITERGTANPDDADAIAREVTRLFAQVAQRNIVVVAAGAPAALAETTAPAAEAAVV